MATGRPVGPARRDRGGSGMDISGSASALGALGRVVEVAADNLANVNTPGFKAGQAQLETGPEGEGVRLAQVQRDPQPGPLLPEAMLARAADGSVSAVAGLVEGSNVDAARELVDLMGAQRAFEANVVAVRAWDETFGLIVNLRV